MRSEEEIRELIAKLDSGAKVPTNTVADEVDSDVRAICANVLRWVLEEEWR